jgi:hypothetical protein
MDALNVLEEADDLRDRTGEWVLDLLLDRVAVEIDEAGQEPRTAQVDLGAGAGRVEGRDATVRDGERGIVDDAIREDHPGVGQAGVQDSEISGDDDRAGDASGRS